MECFVCFSCFIIFADVCFFLLVDSKDYLALHNIGYRKSVSFLLSFFVSLCCFKILLLPFISLRFLFLLYAIIAGLEIWQV